ncbi:MAG: hypothetical protein AAFV29_26360, partial [Myxococcota bacterium]
MVPLELDGSPIKKVEDLAISPDGTLWAASTHALFRIDDIEKGIYATFTHQQWPALPERGILALSFDRNGDLWIGDSGGIARKKADQPAPRRCLPPNPNFGGQDISVSLLNGNLGPYMFLGAWSSGAFFAPLDSTVRKVVPNSRYLPGLPNATIWSIEVGPDGHLVVGTNRGLYEETAAWSERFTPLFPDLFGEQRIYSLEYTPDGTLWVGATTGLSMIREGRITSIKLDLSEAIESSKVRVYELHHHGDLIAVGTDHGLHLLSTEDAQPQHLFRARNSKATVGEAPLTQIETDRIWRIDTLNDTLIATGNDAVFRIDLDTRKVAASTARWSNVDRPVSGRFYAAATT